MKKTLIILTSVLMVLVLIVNIYPLINNTDMLIANAETIINKNIKNINEYGQDIPRNMTGTMQVEAKYKGAHGEVYPAHFSYFYELDNEHLLMENDGIYYEIKYRVPCLDFFINLLNIKEINLSSLMSKATIAKTKDGYQIDLDQDTVNTYFNSNYQKANILITTTGLNKKIKTITLNLDSDSLVINDSHLTFNYDNNKIMLTWNNTGYSLNINDQYRMNVFKDNDKYTYSIVKDDIAFQIIKEGETINFISNTQAAIYNGLDITLSMQNVSFTKENILENPDDNPIIRYFKEIDFNFWRSDNE